MRRALINALSPLTLRGATLWCDENLQAGARVIDETRLHLQTAHIILLLVSPACLASANWRQQVEAILLREKCPGVHIIPVFLRTVVDWQEMPFGHLVPLPADGRAVSSFSPQEKAWFEIAQGISRLVAHPQAATALTIARHLSTQPPAPHPTMSVARPQLVRGIYEQLTSAEVSALVLTGVWGLGKSALAAQICQFAEQQRLDGAGPFLGAALWLEIDPTTSLPDVLVTLCQAYGVSAPAVQNMTPYDLVAALGALLHNSQQPRLIVLNQLENWLNPQTRVPRPEHPGLGELLELLDSRLSASRLLCTSRIYPHGKSQHLEAYVQRVTLTGLTRAEGLQLLRLGKSGETDEALAAAVNWYQGHPLALILLRNLLKEDRNISLTTLLQDLSSRQLLVNDMTENIFQYIYIHQLNQNQRELLLAFAIYCQAVPLQAAYRIVQTRIDLSFQQASAELRVLLNQDLIQATGNLAYSIQPMIKDVVLAQHPDAAGRRQAHQIAAAVYLERASHSLHSTTQPKEMDEARLLLEAAWHYCQADQFAEAYQLIRQEQLFISLHRRGGNSLLLDLYQELLPPEKWEADPLTAGHLYHEMGTIQNALGQKQEAQAFYAQALPFFRQIAEPMQLAEALNDLGTMYRALKQEARADQCYQEAWALCEQAGESSVQRGPTLNNLGRLRYEQGQQQQQRRQKTQARALYLEARALYEQAISAHRSNDQLEETGWTLLNLGDVTTALDELERAYDYYSQALAVFQALGERRGEGTVLNNLGLLLARQQAEQERVAACYLQALRIFRAVGDRWQERKALKNLGRWLLIHVPSQEPARTQNYLLGLACFVSAKDVHEERQRARTEIIPVWLLASLNQDLGEQRTQEIYQEAEARSWQMIEDLLNMSGDFVSWKMEE